MTIRRFTTMCLLFLALPLFAQDMPDPAAQQRWVQFMSPGTAHQHLAQLNGKFKTMSKMWMAPDAPPMESEGTCENAMLMDGRYQRADYAGIMMGMQFKGQSVAGFNNKKQVFESTWIDNWGTAVSMMTGTYNEASHTLTYKGVMYDPMSDKDINIRMDIRYESKDKYVMEMYMSGPGGEFKTFEITHTRAE